MSDDDKLKWSLVSFTAFGFLAIWTAFVHDMTLVCNPIHQTELLECDESTRRMERDGMACLKRSGDYEWRRLASVDGGAP